MGAGQGDAGEAITGEASLGGLGRVVGLEAGGVGGEARGGGREEGIADATTGGAASGAV